MIFVTVGTHEQPFNRLIEEVDRLKKEGVITDEVFIQTGFSTYKPQSCNWKSIISYSEMEDHMANADIIITHGGPATFMEAIAKGKKPIVVPRLEKFGEHVNDHQLDFAYQVKNRHNNIEVIEDIKTLQHFLKRDLRIYKSTISNNKKFNEQLQQLIENIMR